MTKDFRTGTVQSFATDASQNNTESSEMFSSSNLEVALK